MPVRITVSKEDYLKAIAEAQAEGGTVIGAALARRLGVSAPAVGMAVRRLSRDGLVRVNAEGHINLSAAGREIAERLRHRHHLIERMLTEIFGMEWYKVHDEAERLEHAVSGDFEDRLVQVLGEDKAGAHGAVRGHESTKERRQLGWRPLGEAEPGERVQVVSVFERDRKLLEYLDELGVHPGARLVLESRNCDDTVTVRGENGSVGIGFRAAEAVWVKKDGG